MNDIEKIEPELEFNPTTMVISPFSNISNKLKHFASAITDETDADSHLIYVNCFEREIDGVILKVIRLSDQYGMWTELHPYDKVDGDILDRPFAVNLYDLFNVVENCPDELLTLWIDDEDNELVVNSFYNEDKAVDELEVRLTLHGYNPTALEMKSSADAKLLTTISMNALTTHHIMNELNVEHSADGVNIIVSDGKLRFQTAYHGFVSEFKMKEHDDIVFETDVKAFIPFNVFQCMISTGHITDLNFDIYDNHVICLSTDEYEFFYRIEEDKEVHEFDTEDLQRYFIIDAELIEANVKMLNRLNKQSKISNLTIEYVSDGEADISCGLDGRYGISMRTDLAMLSKDTIVVDSDIFQEMVSRTNVDAVMLQYKNPNELYIKMENQLIVKQMSYNHAIFSGYREQKLIEWNEKNA